MSKAPCAARRGRRCGSDQGRAPTTEVGRDQLAVNLLEDELRLDQMHAVALRAAHARWSQFGHAGVVEAADAQPGFDRRAGGGDRRAWLTGMDRDAER